jgi:Glyoxalase-like domain
MGVATWKDLCLDAADPAVVGRFWARALGRPLKLLDDGDAVLRGGPLQALWINRVPEPKVAKNRVHLDLYGRDPADLVALGATILDDHGRWVVLGDPEGNELCLFADPGDRAEAAAPARPFALCVDSARPEELAAWWAAVLDGAVGQRPDGNPRWVHGGAGLGGLILKCVPVTDERAAKNRCHWDVTTDDVGHLVDAGATVLRPRDSEISWTVLADPEGNEFCAFTP